MTKRDERTTPVKIAGDPHGQEGQHLLTVGDAARILRMTPEAIYAALSRRQLPCVRWGRRIRLFQEDLESFLHAHAVPAEDRSVVGPDGRNER